jgi:hypothetical protein
MFMEFEAVFFFWMSYCVSISASRSLYLCFSPSPPFPPPPISYIRLRHFVYRHTRGVTHMPQLRLCSARTYCHQTSDAEYAADQLAATGFHIYVRCIAVARVVVTVVLVAARRMGVVTRSHHDSDREYQQHHPSHLVSQIPATFLPVLALDCLRVQAAK